MTLHEPPLYTREPRRRPWALWVIAAIAILVVLWFVAHLQSQPKQKRGMPPVPVSVATASVQDVPLNLESVGTVDPTDSVAVHAQVTGVIQSIDFQQGQRVKAGQLLFQIDPRPFQAAYDQAKAQLARDTAQANQAASEAQRYAGLLKQGYVSQEQAEQYAATAASTGATLQADSAALENARVQLGYTRITSPIDGVAGVLQLTQGNLVRSGDAAPLVTINKVAPIYVTFNVPENQVDTLRRYARGGALPVTALAAGATHSVEGTLSFLDNAVDPANGTLKARATFANDDGALVPGEYVDVSVALAQEHALAVPVEAIVTGQNGSSVFVVQPDGTAKLVPVTLERSTATIAVITSGLSPGAEVVTRGQVALHPGGKVSITPPGGANEASGTAGLSHGHRSHS
ncbi:MAG TPA: efflux RND transporter periplasmic adaptor subunit [Oscillatoriaceae cyanobacterium]